MCFEIIRIIHSWCGAAEGNGGLVRVVPSYTRHAASSIQGPHICRVGKMMYPAMHPDTAVVTGRAQDEWRVVVEICLVVVPDEMRPPKSHVCKFHTVSKSNVTEV